MPYTKDEIHEIVERQREFFRSGVTLDVDWRIMQLKKLRDAMTAYRSELEAALAADLGRAPTEAYFSDIGAVILEVNETIQGLRRWAKPERHYSGVVCFPSTVTRVYKMPYGVTLIISPFNFPILLTFGVLAAAIAGGNTAVIKASSKSKHCTALMQRIAAELYNEAYITVIDGGHDTAGDCLSQRFDKIFYTGSPAVGKHVLAMAAQHLTPVALELGGETGNWAIVRRDADLHDAARKIAFFKLCNSGQICINVNQVAVAEEVAVRFVALLKAEFTRQIGDALTNGEYPRLITRSAYEKCAREAEQYRDRIVYGGTGDPETLRYAPTVIYPVDRDEEIVRHELFCPLLPIVPFPEDNVEDILRTVEEREHPLALYLFTGDIRWGRKVMQRMQYGGGCINEVCVHMMVKGVPFNGTGHSGMGAYHGEWGFREFTHPATVLEGRSRFNLPLREHPYTKWKQKFIELFER